MTASATPNDRSRGTRWGTIRLGQLIRVARPGLMLSHLWAYLLPAIGGGFRPSATFWTAAVYVTVPLGVLIYGWNDYFDRDVDSISQRKNDPVTSAVFGPALSRQRLAALPTYLLMAQLPFAILWAVTGRLSLLGWMALMATGNALYNGPGVRLSRVPVLAELTATAIYVLIVWLGVLTHSGSLPWWGWAFATLSILNLQILGALVDRHEDATVGKRTLAVALGRSGSLAVVLVLLLARVGLTLWYVRDPIATAAMILGVLLVAGGMSVLTWRRSSTAYSTFILLDWVWLVVVLLR